MAAKILPLLLFQHVLKAIRATANTGEASSPRTIHAARDLTFRVTGGTLVVVLPDAYCFQLRNRSKSASRTSGGIAPAGSFPSVRMVCFI